MVTTGGMKATKRNIQAFGQCAKTPSVGPRQDVCSAAAAGLLIGLLVLLALTGTAGATERPSLPYSDIAEHPAGHHIHLLTARGIIDGFPDGTFRPRQSLTRAQFAKLLVSALELPLPDSSAPSVFNDVAQSHWAASFIGAAWEHGLIEGLGDGRFAPEGNLTRAELAVLIDRALHRVVSPGGEPPPVVSGETWSDSGQVPEWAWPAAMRMASLGIMPGDETAAGTVFRPLDRADRGETAEALARFMSHTGLAYDLFGIVDAAEGVDHFTVSFQGSSGLRRFALGEDTPVWRNGRPISPASLEPLDEVALVLVDGEVRFISAWFLDDLGVVRSVSNSSRTISYRSSDGSFKQAALKVGASIYRNGRPALLQSLNPGDSIYLLFSVFDGSLRTVDAVDVQLRGNIHTLRLNNGTLRVLEGPGRSRTVTVASSVIIFLDGRRSALDQLRVGDLVYAAFNDSERAVYLEVYRLARDPRRT